MQANLQRQPIEEVQTDALLVLVFQERRDDRLGLGELFDAGEISGKPLEMTLLHNVPGVRAKRVLAVGAGKPAKFTAAELRRAVGAADPAPEIEVHYGAGRVAGRRPSRRRRSVGGGGRRHPGRITKRIATRRIRKT